MYTLYSIESSFIFYALILQVIFSLVTFFIALTAYKIFGITQNSNTRSMALAFFFICISYAVQALFNFLIFLRVQHDFLVMFGIHPLSVLNEQGLYLHMVFMSIGLAILMFNAFKTNNKSVLWYMIISSVMVLFLSKNILFGFFMLTSLYFGFLAHYFYSNYRKNRKKGALMIAVSFIFLFFGNLLFIFMRKSAIFYAIAHLFDFLGYLLILINYYTIRK
jgi:hypothetical protein